MLVDKRTVVPLCDVCYDRFRKMRKGVRVMAMLTDEMLLDSYHMAIELKLEREFITLLLAEIHKRNLDTDSISILH